MNVLILAAGANKVVSEANLYPLSLLELRSSPLLAVQVAKWKDISVQFIFMFRQADIEKFYLDRVARQINDDAKVIGISGDTAGAACTALLAAEFIDNNEPLVITNGDELIDIDYRLPLQFFSEKKYSAGTLVFDSIHPRYSYVKLNDGLVVQAAEKIPISRSATAGFYWYSQGKDFVAAAKKMIKKQYLKGPPFYICPVFNELILEQKLIGSYAIENKAFHPVKSQQQLRNIESMLDV